MIKEYKPSICHTGGGVYWDESLFFTLGCLTTPPQPAYQLALTLILRVGKYDLTVIGKCMADAQLNLDRTPAYIQSTLGCSVGIPPNGQFIRRVLYFF